jgi:hypothetical protein
MAVVSLSPGAWADGFAAADLNALANGGLAISSLTAPIIDNSAGANLFVQFEVVLAALSPIVGANMLPFLVPETSVANTYMTGSTGTTSNDHYRWQNGPYAVVGLRFTASSAQTQRSPLIQIAPERYIFGLINRSGVALAATGNQVRYRLISEVVE